MKIFERWLRKNVSDTFSGIRYDSINEDLAAKEGWRAAMEEVLGWLDYSAEHKEIADKIHEELES